MALEDPKNEIRKGAAVALGELKAEPAVDPLAALFNDPDSGVALSAVEALVSIGNAPATVHLINALQLENTDARIAAASGLGTLNAANAVDALINVLDDSEESVTCAAATSLGLIGDEKASSPLAAKLKAPSVKLRLACAQALASTQGKAAIEGLVGALADDNADVRSAAIDALATIGQPCIPSVLDALKDVPRIRRLVVMVQREVADRLLAQPGSKTYGIPSVICGLHAAGHMAFMNLGFGRLADVMDVRLLLVIPGIVWMVVFVVAGATLPEARSILRSGAFTHTAVRPVTA